MVEQKAVSFLQRVGPVLKQRCPRCLDGPVFDGLLRMNRCCPRCDLRFEREPGYFTGAMYISYGLAVLSIAPPAVILGWLGLPGVWIFALIGLQLVLSSPLLLRYSRVLWLHLDQMIDPQSQ